MFNFEVAMKELILIRHGESQYNACLTDHLDSELTHKGIEQARITGKFLKEQFGHIHNFVGITSPYIRCLQTSRILREETGLEFTVNPGPREIMMKYQAAEVKNRRDKFPEFVWNHDDDLFFSQESDIQFINRIKDFHDSLNHEKLVVVSHGTPVNTIYEFALGLKANADTVNFVKNCSVSYVRNGEGIWFGKVVYDE
jgi:broad specificity phosphatase PhoE